MFNRFTGRPVRSLLRNIIAIPVGIIILVIVAGPA
jgi:hypothetical protein